MDNIQKTPNAEMLRQMPYSELKKIAKQRGIKGNLKAEKMIAALMSSTDSDDTDSFSTPAAKEINSSRKKKLEKFDEVNRTPLATPRRGTYSIEPPIALKVDAATPSMVNKESSVLEVPNMMSSIVNEIAALDVTSSIANESSVLDMSNVTVGRGSERKCRTRKVSFLSPVMTPHTPKNTNLKLRPKTPIGSRTPLPAEFSPLLMKELQVNLGERVDTSFGKASLPENVCDEASTRPLHLTNNEVSTKKKHAVTPRVTRSLLNKNELSKKKRVATPNFKQIHAKAFEQMESIDDYQKRLVRSAKKMGIPVFKPNKVTKAKTKIPAFGGIPFIPSVVKFNAVKEVSTFTRKQKIEEKKPKKDAENVNARRNRKFDLKASLSRKLGYTPYSGPVKPLTPSSLLNASNVACVHKSRHTPLKEPVNKVVSSKRMQNRSILKGVRTNKRFELQMRNRKLE